MKVAHKFFATCVPMLPLLLAFCVPAIALSPGPPDVTSLFVPLQGEVLLSNNDTVIFSGQVHVLTQIVFSDTDVPSVSMYVNVIRVEGTSPTTGNTYLLVGAANVQWAGINPGPPNIPEQTFEFSLVQISPGPPDTPPNPIFPVYLHNFTFSQEAGSEGTLLSVEASFVSD